MNTKNENINENREDRERLMHEEFLSDQGQPIQNYWKEMDDIANKKDVDVNKAWNKLYSRLEDDELIDRAGIRVFMNPAFRIAASVLLIIALSISGLYIGTDIFNTGNTNLITAESDQKNIQVDLPDGSKVFLNRNSSIEFPDKFTEGNRTVNLKGEAFFEITPNTEQPFIVNAGDANITVLGTSFNVLTDTEKVQVLVETGKVLLEDNTGAASLTLQPGELGTVQDNQGRKEVNSDPNYMSWKTEILEFNGDNLEKVFSDLKRAHNINVKSDNEDINNLRITSVYDNQSPDTIIRIICTTFNLDYTKEGDTYYLIYK